MDALVLIAIVIICILVGAYGLRNLLNTSRLLKNDPSISTMHTEAVIEQNTEDLWLVILSGLFGTPCLLPLISMAT